MSSIRVGQISELPPGKGKVVDAGERRITVYNDDGRLHATASRRRVAHPEITETAGSCSHQGLVFDVFAEDSPAKLRADDLVCGVRVEDGTIWLELPTEH